jgi:threonine synthase
MIMNGYCCIACGTTQSADFSGYQCPACSSNLEITYDYAASAGDVEQGFDGDDIFRYAALLPVARPKPGFPLRIGATPLYKAPRLGESLGLQNLYLKDDTGNPSASIKDRATAVALLRAKELGATTVAVASTGNAGSSTACIAAALGMQAIVFVPESAPAAKLTQSLAYGATVLAVRGNYDDAYDLCLQACDEFGWFNRSTGYNAFTREGKKTCAFEIWEDLGKVPDRIVVPTGDGNILSAIWKGWRELQAVGLTDKLPKIDCAQSESSAAICDAVAGIRASGAEPDWSKLKIDDVDARTVADSIAVNRPRDGLGAVRAIIESGGKAVTIPDVEILAAIPEIAQATGIFAEPAAAAPLAAVKRLSQRDIVNPDDLVVCLVTGNGLKDVAAAAGASGKALNIDPTIEAVRARE